MKEEGQRSAQGCLKILIFASGLSSDLSKFSDEFSLFFRLRMTMLLLVPSWEKIKISEATFCCHEHDEQVCQFSWRYSKGLKS